MKMMKWLFFMLLVINLILGGLVYTRFQQSSRTLGASNPSMDIGGLKLLSEVSPEALQDSATRPSMAGIETDAQRAQMFTQQQDATGHRSDAGAPGVEAGAGGKQSVRSDQATSAEAGGDDSRSVAGTGMPSTATPGATAELPARETGLTAESASLEELHCFTLGPFKKRSEAEGLLAQLEPKINTPDLRQQSMRKHAGYWVLIPAGGSSREARQMVRTLKEAGIKDVWRFTKGKLRNAISLGLYSRKQPAERHSRQINKKGFNSRVQPRYVEESRYWLDFQAAKGFALPSLVGESIAEVYPDAGLTGRACPDPQQ